MRAAAYATTVCAMSVTAAAMSFPGIARELLVGMGGPLVVAVTSFVLVERVYRQDPKRLMPLMIKAFGTKMVFFASYVTVVIALTALDPTPFVLSFCVYFVGLHLTEALVLRSLFTEALS